MKQIIKITLLAAALAMVLSCTACQKAQKILDDAQITAAESSEPTDKASEKESAKPRKETKQGTVDEKGTVVGDDESTVTVAEEGTEENPFAKEETSAQPQENKKTETGKTEGSKGGEDTVDEEPSAPPVTPTGNLKWEEFYALSSAEKDAYKDSFASKDDFYDWMVAAQEQFKIDHPDIEIGPGGTIDLSLLK